MFWVTNWFKWPKSLRHQRHSPSFLYFLLFVSPQGASLLQQSDTYTLFSWLWRFHFSPHLVINLLVRKIITDYVSLLTLPKQFTSIFIIPEILFTMYTTLPVSIWHIKKQANKKQYNREKTKKIPKSGNDDNVIGRDLHKELSRAESKAWELPIPLQKSPHHSINFGFKFSWRPWPMPRATPNSSSNSSLWGINSLENIFQRNTLASENPFKLITDILKKKKQVELYIK